MLGASSVLALGDFNWDNGYDRFLHSGWATAPKVVTTLKNTAPTRCLLWRSDFTDNAPVPPTCTTTLPVDNVPHHLLVAYSADLPLTWTPDVRMRRAADFELFEADRSVPSFSIGPQHRFTEIVDDAAPQPPNDADLVTKWKNWYARAEKFLHLMADDDLLTRKTKPERPFGSSPTQRPSNCKAHHRLREPVSLRRLRRLHRTFASSHARRCTQLTNRQWFQWAAAIRDGIVVPTTGYPTINTCIASVSNAVTEEERNQGNHKVAEWRLRFRTCTTDIWDDARRVIKGPPAVPLFNAETMREDWASVWAPQPYDDVEILNTWLRIADTDGDWEQPTFMPTRLMPCASCGHEFKCAINVASPKCPSCTGPAPHSADVDVPARPAERSDDSCSDADLDLTTDWLPTRQCFQNQLLDVQGAPGLDGMSSSSLRA